MASVLKATVQAARLKAKLKVGDACEGGDDEEILEEKEGEERQETKPRKKNKQRVLLLSSRGITQRMRHLMNDLEALLPHVKKGACLNLFFVSFFLKSSLFFVDDAGCADSKLD